MCTRCSPFLGWTRSFLCSIYETRANKLTLIGFFLNGPSFWSMRQSKSVLISQLFPWYRYYLWLYIYYFSKLLAILSVRSFIKMCVWLEMDTELFVGFIKKWAFDWQKKWIQYIALGQYYVVFCFVLNVIELLTVILDNRVISISEHLKGSLEAAAAKRVHGWSSLLFSSPFHR